MSKAKQRDRGKEAFWREVVAKQAKSGQTVRAFCRQRKIREHNFYGWKRELGLREKEAPVFAAVTMTPAVESRALAEDEIEIRLPGGSRVRFRGGCQEALLEKALSLLEGRGC